MDWFRWHHGSVTDPKFQVVARRAGASVAEVVAVWACLLEAASANEADRGNIGNIDLEAIECLLGLPESRAFAICQAMDERNLLDFSSGRVGAWERRQPKRERDDNSTERSRAFRERHRAAQQDQAKERHATPCNADDDQGNASATPCNAMQRSETPRLEKRREEEDQELGPKAAPSDQPTDMAKAKADRAERLAVVTEDAIETFNASPFTVANGGRVPNVTKVNREKRRQQVNRSVRVIREICSEEFGAPEITREFWAGYWQIVNADAFASGRQGGSGAHANWRPDFEYLTRPDTITALWERAEAAA